MAKKSASKKPADRHPQLRVVDNAAPLQADPPRRKLISFDAETFAVLDLYRRDSMKDWEELAEEAFRDLLAKHGRTADLRTALKRIAQDVGAEDSEPEKKSKTPTRSKRV